MEAFKQSLMRNVFWKGDKIMKIWNKIKYWFYSFKRKELYYVGDAEVMPKTLSKEEEAYWIKKLEEGDTKARQVLIERNLRLVAYIARKFENCPTSQEDLISIGTIGIIKGITTFDSSKNIKLATYASRCIENEILMHLRKIGSRRSEVSFDEPLNVDWDGNELLLSDILGTEPDVVHKNIEEETDKEILQMCIAKLSDKEREILILRYGLNGKRELTQKEVADIMGISQSYISRLEKKILKRLKNEFLKTIG